MFDYASIPKRQTLTCEDCGQKFSAIAGNPVCNECQYDRDHPEEAPKHWTWTRAGSKWTIVATWPYGEPLPNAGDTVTVHRKDGSSSEKAISEVDGIIYDMRGRGRLHCWVK